MQQAPSQPLPHFAHHLRLEEEEFAQSQPSSSPLSGTRSPTSSTDLDDDTPFQPIHYQNGVIARTKPSHPPPASNAAIDSFRPQVSDAAKPSSPAQDSASEPPHTMNGVWNSEAIHSMTSNGYSSPYRADAAFAADSRHQNGSEQQAKSPELLSSLTAGEHEVFVESDVALERSSWADNASDAPLPDLAEAAPASFSEAPRAAFGMNGTSSPLHQAHHHDRPAAEQSGGIGDASWTPLPGSAGQAAEVRPMPDSQAAADAALSTSGRGSSAGSKSPESPLRMTFGQPGPNKPPGAGRMPGSASPPNSRTQDAASAKLSPDAASPATLPGRSLPGTGAPQPVKRAVNGYSKAYMRGRGSVMGRPSTNQRPTSDRHWGAAAFPTRHLTNSLHIGVLAALLY